MPNVNLQSLNTLAVPSLAQRFFEIKSKEEIADVITSVQQSKEKLTVLGGGSNVILPEFLSGLVVKYSVKGHQIISETENDIVVEFAAGENWHDVVMWSVNNNYYGIENLALIPGSIGAAPIQNIGAYGVELTDSFECLSAIEISSGQQKRFSREECKFGYRESVFKQELKDTMLITSVALRLKKTPHLVLDYPALSNFFKGNDETVLAKNVAEAVISIRQSKLPDPKNIPNAGSFFKNPIVNPQVYKQLKDKYKDLVAYSLPESNYKLAAGWLLDKAGWKGREVNQLAMHKQQALVLTNPNFCTGKEILAFAEKVSLSIQQQFGVSLEIEPRVY
ncbi:MAG: UDP-N-acetylmuramate dehydrogenase [Cellvibrionaceae bacterium]